MTLRVPLFDIDLTTAEKDAVRKVLDSGWLTQGARVREAEEALCRLTGAHHAVAVGSGTAALHLSLLALGVGPGDEVICPSLTFVATPHAVRYVGATPVFCDIDQASWNLDPDDVERRLTPRTRAVIAVHYAGRPVDLPRLRDLCAANDLHLVEDVAHALISTFDGIACGRWGVCGCFSFFSNKNVTCGEGGMILTDDDALAERLRRLRSHGLTSSTMERHAGRALSYDVEESGFNYRLDEMRAALLLAQFDRLEEFLDRRDRLVDRYRDLLADLPIETPRSAPGKAQIRTAHHIFPVLLPTDADRRSVMQSLRENGVQTSIHYPPAHLLSVFFKEGVRLTRTEDVAARELTLPLFPSMTDDQQDLVVRSLQGALASASSSA